MEEQLHKIRDNADMVVLVNLAFNYEMDMLDIENELFMEKDRSYALFQLLSTYPSNCPQHPWMKHIPDFIVMSMMLFINLNM